MKKIQRGWLAAIGALVVAAAVGVGATMAQEGTPVPGASMGISMLDRVAAKLGIDSVTLRDAIKSSASDEISEKLAAGEITQEQADAMQERIETAPDGSPIGGGRGFGGPGHGPGGFGHAFVSGELATFLGVTAEELRSELQAEGATLASVGEAHGQSRDALKAFLTEQAQARLDGAVAEGRLTQEEADAKLAEQTSNLDAIIDGTMPFGGPGHGRPRGDFALPPDAETAEADDSSSS